MRISSTSAQEFAVKVKVKVRQCVISWNAYTPAQRTAVVIGRRSLKEKVYDNSSDTELSAGSWTMRMKIEKYKKLAA